MNPVKVYVGQLGTTQWEIWPSFPYNATLDQLASLWKMKGMTAVVEWKGEEGGHTGGTQLHTLVGKCIKLYTSRSDVTDRYYVVHFE